VVDCATLECRSWLELLLIGPLEVALVGVAAEERHFPRCGRSPGLRNTSSVASALRYRRTPSPKQQLPGYYGWDVS
jgi:hypothetical protein